MLEELTSRKGKKKLIQGQDAGKTNTSGSSGARQRPHLNFFNEDPRQGIEKGLKKGKSWVSSPLDVSSKDKMG